MRQLIADGKVRPLPLEVPLDIIDPLPYDLDHVRRGLIWKRVTDLTVGDHIAFPLPSVTPGDEAAVIDASEHLGSGNYTVLEDRIYYGRGRRQYAEAFDYLSRRAGTAGTQRFRCGEKRRLLKERAWTLRDLEDAQEQIKAPGADRRWFPRFIPVDEAFAALCGYFVAEGYSDGGAVVWHFHCKEVEYWTEIGAALVNLVGRPGVLRRRMGNAVQYDVCIYPLAQILISLFGSGAHNKHVPSWWPALPRPVQISFLRALFNGDGHVLRAGNRIALGLTTVSVTLATQVRDILLSLGIVAGVQKKAAQRTRMANGSVINSGPAFVVSIFGDEAKALAGMLGYANTSEPRNQRTLWYRDDRYLYLRVNSIVSLPEGAGAVPGAST